jgi:regulation of enolase protein 1 (concanavalin A-like superfamily)
MHRLAALFVCALLAVAAVAAPAPFRPSGPWFSGWDKPVDSVGDCTFDRNGDKLTLIVPAQKVRNKGPRLLRNVEGDFVAQVRITSTFRPAGKGEYDVAAALWITDGSTSVFLARSATGGVNGLTTGFHVIVQDKEGKWPTWKMSEKNPVKEAAVVRLERRGDRITAAFSDEGDRPEVQALELKLPRKIKVGVQAGSGSTETFRATFDQFKLTPLDGQAR